MIVPDSAAVSQQQAVIDFSVIIPFYNQSKYASRSIDRVRKILESLTSSYEMIAVNDGSKDNTLEVLRNEQELDPRVKSISYSQNRGKGHAVRTGVASSQGKVVVFMDGDLEISPNTLSDFVRQLEDFDLLIASKAHRLSTLVGPPSATYRSRRFLSEVFNLLVRITTGVKLRDTQSGLKVGKGDALRAIFKIMLVDRFAFDVEMLTIAYLLGLRIKEMPIELTYGGGFKVKEMARMFRDVLAISYRYRISRWYFKQLEAARQQESST